MTNANESRTPPSSVSQRFWVRVCGTHTGALSNRGWATGPEPGRLGLSQALYRRQCKEPEPSHSTGATYTVHINSSLP